MAFQSVNSKSNGRLINPNKDMQVGASVEGYVTGFSEGKHGPIINLKTAQGEELGMFTTGNLRYAVKDGKIQQGLLTRITREEDTKIKGMNSSRFDIQQDPDQSLEDADFSAIFEAQPATPQAAPAPTRAATTTQAMERNAVAQRAADLAKAAKANKRA